LLAHDKHHGLFDALFPLAKHTQALALLEIAHAPVGLVRTSPVTTAMQVVLEKYSVIVSTTNNWDELQRA